MRQHLTSHITIMLRAATPVKKLLLVYFTLCTFAIMCTQNYQSSSFSRLCVMNHNWSATKQRIHPQSVAEISRHSVLSGDRIRQCETSPGSRHKDTDQNIISKQ